MGEMLACFKLLRVGGVGHQSARFHTKMCNFYLETCEAFLIASESRKLKITSRRFGSSMGFRFMMINYLGLVAC